MFIHRFGLFACSHSAESALFALYDVRPPFRLTSLDTVEGARLSCFAISQVDNCDDKQRDIYSLSRDVKCDAALVLSGDFIPHVRAINPCILECILSNIFPM